ncbi:MAG: hypothetical protein K6F33_09800 [Bacteroidales bacterium]|nr:hypothetical protein [Bacteroidales bacterium]
MKKYILAASIAAGMALSANAQDNNQCAMEYSMYKEFVNVEAYSEARESFWKVFNDCPKFSKNIYIDGVKIYREMIKMAGEDDDAIVNAYVDTLGIIYRQRIKNFGEEANVLCRYGMEVSKYRCSDTADMESYHLMGRAIAVNPNDPEVAAVASYLQTACTLLQKSKIDHQQFFGDITPVIMATYRQRAIKGEKYGETIDKIIAVVKRILAQNPAKSPTFDEMFVRRYQLPDDIHEVSVLTNTMNVYGCDGNDLYAQCAERLYKKNPTAEAAASLARYNRKTQRYDVAAKYYAEAVDMEQDAESKSVYLYEAATVANNLHKYYDAVSMAKKSAAANSKNGAPLLLIAAIYMVNANSFGDDDFAHRTVYWVAADYAQKAKAADMNLTEEANTLVSKCKQQFPKKDDAFMHSVNAGDVVTVKCFDTETTKARF